MSLLLEALKKAERDKLGHDSARRGAEGKSADGTTNHSTRLSKNDSQVAGYSSLNDAAAEATLPGYPNELELVLKEAVAASGIPQQHPDREIETARRESVQERKTAQNMFAAKRGGISSAGTGKRLMVAGVALIAIAGGAYYVWQEATRISGIGQPQVARQASISPVPPTRMSAPATAAAPVAKEATPPVQPSAKDAVAAKIPPARARVDSHSTRLANDTSQVAGYPTAEPEPAIRIQRKQNVNEVPPLLAAAYRAYLAGDLDAARQQYLKQLQNDPLNKDVLMGLAAIAVRRQLPTEAQAYYLRILELDPRDPAAIAGMTGLGQHLDPGQTESRLKILLAQQPEAAVLHFTLGNHYAGQSRWGEAQQAFFRALSIDSANAEYAFNLAVSLDHLNQDKLAAEYYGKALALTGATPAGFDKTQASARLKELAR